MFIKNLPLVVTLLVFTACSSGPKVQEYPDTANPTEELSKFDTDMGNALANQVNVLSPENYKHASASLGDARKNLDKQNSAKDTLHDVAVHAKRRSRQARRPY